MMELIIIASVLNFFIGFIALKSGIKNKLIISFAVLCFLTSLWSFFNFLMYFYNNPIFLKEIYALGDLTATALLGWLFFYDEKNKKYWQHSAIYISGFIVSIFTLINGLVIENAGNVSLSGVEVNPGIFFGVWILHMIVMVIWSLIKIAYIFYKSNKKRIQIWYVMIGVAGFAGTSLLVSVIFPIFGIFSFTNLDSPSSLFFAIFVGIAMTKYQFLNRKMVNSQLLIAIVLSISVVEIFYAHNKWEMLARLAIFFIFFIFGLKFTGTIAQEVRHKEKIEKANCKLTQSNKELQLLSRKLEKTNKKLKKLDRQKTEFLSLASHQFRSPLNIIKGKLSLVLNDDNVKIPEDVKKVCQESYDSVDKMLSLVGDFLNLSRIETGKFEYFFEKVNVENIVQNVVFNFQQSAKEKGISLEYEKTEDRIPEIQADKGKMEEVLINLIDNSIKCTDKGEVKVKLKKDDIGILIEVADTGKGICKEDMKKIFSKFYKGNGKERVTGTGLGLYVSKQFVKAHKGKIWAESDGKGKGASFFVKLPLELDLK